MAARLVKQIVRRHLTYSWFGRAASAAPPLSAVPARRTTRRRAGVSASPEPFVECKDMRLSEPSSERYRRIRLRHAAAGSDLVATLVRVN